MIELFLLLVIFFLLFTGSWISAAETALFSLPETRLSAFRIGHNDREKRIGDLLLHPQDLLVTIFMVNTIVNILLQNAISSIVGDRAGFLFKVGVPFLLILILGEILPKYYGIQHNLSFSKRVIYSIERLQKWLSPLRKGVVILTRRLSRIIFFFLKRGEPLSKKEIELLVTSSANHGVLKKEEEALIHGYLSLAESPVKDHMWPRKEVIAYEISEPLSKLSHLFTEKKLSRIPVIDKTLDHAFGFIEAPQFFQIEKKVTSGESLKSFLVQPLYIPENTSAKVLLDRFQRERAESALIVDEYGVISGLITQEDLMEIVVGPITDSSRQESLFTLSPKNELICSATLPINEFNALFHTSLDSKAGFSSIGGWVVEKLQTIPKTGASFSLQGLHIHVLAAESTHIEKLFIRRELNG